MEACIKSLLEKLDPEEMKAKSLRLILDDIERIKGVNRGGRHQVFSYYPGSLRTGVTDFPPIQRFELTPEQIEKVKKFAALQDCKKLYLHVCAGL